MGGVASVPDKNLLPVQIGSLPEFMATIHKLWESLPLGFLVPGLTMGYATS